ncbi:phenylalanine--tRNA ligase subunit beta [Idiomarina xiamenensis]|uniref:Phenylalanine--tRNA ligase beta subunit n=1 Tax=Idiomarina xiamenensis 10-D-4 TaxID=740709 RepID=K2KWM8_9GAMM|nr:phenylalanine--tRNA ligase subunit beta [Idiomarina xiamenensis]EKE86894.1 phenylalanyl-tRNA ligase subunit beta [Idiomarina xiamenensis 10-D-4]
MKFSESWLREWVNPDLDSQALADQFSMAGLEVDDVLPVAEAFSGVVVGHVVSCGPHPDADKLQVTQVDVGSGELLDIVCGAPNCRQGLKVAVATVGAVLPGNFKIKKTKLRGQPSHGMLCSASELGLSDDHEGISELPESAPIGQDYRQYLQLDDQIIDIDLTANRGDCLSIRGLAREMSVLTQQPLQKPDLSPVEVSHQQQVTVDLQAPQACPRYLARVIKGVDLTQQSPVWLTERLRRSGIRSIDPVVDVTNYVLLELGHPLHGFDLAKIEGGIQVRFAKPAETLTLLDGNTVELDDDVLVIADQQKALAMAGIFGGEDSGVSAQTQDILLESAFFSPTAILGKARRFGLHTDASHRYERGVDPQLQYQAMERASALLLSICGGQTGPIVAAEAEQYLPTREQVKLRESRLAQVLGVTIDTNVVSDILTRLGLQPQYAGAEWTCQAPAWRFDIAIEEDLIEEVARIYGYNRIAAEAPAAQLRMTERRESQLPLTALTDNLVHRGYQEAITYSFVDPKHQALLFNETAALSLPNPISVDMSSMRVSLWPGLIGAASYNQKRQQQQIALFESGLRFIADDNADCGVQQQPMLAGLRAGKMFGEHWSDGDRAVDFYDVKGDVEALIAQTADAAQFRFVADQHPALHPGQCAAIYKAGRLVGYVGAIHPQFEKPLGLNGRTFVFEIEQAALLHRPLPEAQTISKQPSMRRDIALVVSTSVAAGEVLAAIENIGVNQLVGLNLFDVYRGQGVADGQQSLALSLTFQHPERSLDEHEVNEAMNTVVKKLESEFQATLRD